MNYKNYKILTPSEHWRRLQKRIKEEDNWKHRLERENMEQRLTETNWKYITVDNRGGEFFIEQRNTKKQAIKWLNEF